MGLTKTETAILANAARRESRALLPLPRFIFVRGISVIIALQRLVGRGFVAERQAVGEEPVWRMDRMPMTLEVAEAGLAALNGIAPAPDQPAVRPDSPPAATDALPDEARHRVLMAIMSRPQGADVKLIQHETGLPLHSVRTAINLLRAEGYLFDHVRDGLGGTTYRLIGWLRGDVVPEQGTVSERLYA
jgi:hypothetical protein